MTSNDPGFFRDLIPPEHELKRVGPIFDEKTYLATGRNSRAHLVKYANLKPHYSVLDVGCGFGRVAIQLLDLLSPESSYLGIDVVKSEIEWCQQKITPRNERFLFRHLDVRNAMYNSTGTLAADNVQFPVPNDLKFDLAFLFSVFTHMLPGHVHSYLDEISRHLKPGGTLFASFFLINDDSRRLMDDGRSEFRFIKQSGGYYAHNLTTHEGAVAYDEEDVWRMMMTTGFIRDKAIYGRWAGRLSADNGQDFIVCNKPK
jgi:SAM-dependent methyltransferase